MKIQIHRGNNDISHNLVEISSGSTKIILECGWDQPRFDGTGDFGNVLVPGLTYGNSAYAAVFVLNHQADHREIIEKINVDIPIYMNRDTKILLDIVSDFNNAALARADNELEHGQKIQVGDITLLPLSVDRKIKGKMLLLVEGNGKKLLYTDGFRSIDPAYFSILGKIDILLCEGMNLGSKNDIHISELGSAITKYMYPADKHIFILSSITDVEKIKCVEKACRASGRTLAFDPLLKVVQDRMTNPLFINPVGFLSSETIEDKPRILQHIIANNDVEFYDVRRFVDMDTFSRMSRLAVMVRPSMGDYMRRMDELTSLSGATLVNLMWDRYRRTKPVKDFLELCQSLGMKVETVAASNHAYREQLRDMVTELQPKAIVPVADASADIFCLSRFSDRLLSFCYNDL